GLLTGLLRHRGGHVGALLVGDVRKLEPALAAGRRRLASRSTGLLGTEGDVATRGLCERSAGRLTTLPAAATTERRHLRRDRGPHRVGIEAEYGRRGGRLARVAHGIVRYG